MTLKYFISAMVACTIMLCTSAFAKDRSDDVQLALGSYIGRDFSKKPILLRSEDQGKLWSYNYIIWNNPSDSSDEAIHNVFCESGSCIATGTYKNEQDRNLYPLIIYTTNQGRSWSYGDLHTSEHLSDGRLYASHCLGDRCVAAGEVGSGYDDYHRLPLILFSMDKGKSWDKATIADINNADRGVVNVIYCSIGDKCLASGSFTYAKQKKRQLMMLSSANGGRYWKHNHYITNVPTTLVSSTVNEIYCQDKLCLASGSYDTSDSKRLPLLLKTDDAGSNWEFISSIENFPDNFQRTTLGKFSCSMNDCIVTGKNDADSAALFTIASHDKGNTWKYLPGNMFPSFMQYPEISAITFVDQTCIMLGNYRDNHHKDQLLFFVSKDKGNTWSGMPKIDGFPSRWRKNIRFDSMNCSGKNCFIAGSYDDQIMFLTSNDGAESWMMPKEDDIHDLPSFMENVRLPALAFIK